MGVFHCVFALFAAGASLSSASDLAISEDAAVAFFWTVWDEFGTTTNVCPLLRATGPLPSTMVADATTLPACLMTPTDAFREMMDDDDCNDVVEDDDIDEVDDEGFFSGVSTELLVERAILESADLASSDSSSPPII